MNQPAPQEEIAHALSALMNLPLWAANRAADMEMFQFGERRVWKDTKAIDREVGEYALHIQCPWRIVNSHGIVVGSQDIHYPLDESADWDQADGTRRDRRIAAWLGEHSSAQPRVERIETDSVGGFKLFMEHNVVLEVFPAHSLRGEYSEHWRLFRPSEEGRHFAVTGHGVER